MKREPSQNAKLLICQSISADDADEISGLWRWSEGSHDVGSKMTFQIIVSMAALAGDTPLLQRVHLIF